MIYPIVAYGDNALRESTRELSPETPDLQQIIANMYETMYNASGVGLAAPQVGLPYRLFVVDAKPMKDLDDEPDTATFRQTFINPEILAEEGDEWDFEEGCLSIPGIRETVWRQPKITIRYYDENWEEHTRTLTGIKARIVQHEYDHIEGVLFTDYLSGLKKRLLKKKLNKIAKGKIEVDYEMRFPLAGKPAR